MPDQTCIGRKHFNVWRGTRTSISLQMCHEIKLGRNNRTAELNRRIGLARAAYEKLKDVCKRDIPMCLKRKVFD